MIDFTPVSTGRLKLSELANDVNPADLRAATNAQIDTMLALIGDLNDAQVTFVAADAEAPEGIGWNVGHLLAHVTATSEESAAVSSVLARGIAYPLEPRLRAEVDWPTLTTTAACIGRLEESRRMRLGYLSAWPDAPRLDTYRTLPESFAAMVGPMNAVGSYLLGLLHEANQLPQLREIVAQARKAA